MSIQETTSEPIIMLVDNGSTRVDAAVQLRKIAKKLGAKAGRKIHAVSMQHSDRISKEDILEKLSGKPAQVFKEFMTEQLKSNQKDFILLPLFFGKSRAITSFVPTEIALLEAEFGSFKLSIADVLYPLPDGDSRLIEILHQHATNSTTPTTSTSNTKEVENLVLVDHGSPLPAVNEVRQHIANKLSQKLPRNIQLKQAAMERRKGKEYDFNGQLLEDFLNDLAQSGETYVTVLLLFLLPGTHAGENGDIVQICNAVMKRHPKLNISISPLIGENKRLIDCLSDRLDKVLS